MGFNKEEHRKTQARKAKLETLCLGIIKMRLKTFQLKYLSWNCSGYKKNYLNHIHLKITVDKYISNYLASFLA
jgi:hypothetical protein